MHELYFQSLVPIDTIVEYSKVLKYVVKYSLCILDYQQCLKSDHVSVIHIYKIAS